MKSTVASACLFSVGEASLHPRFKFIYGELAVGAFVSLGYGGIFPFPEFFLCDLTGLDAG